MGPILGGCYASRDRSGEGGGPDGIGSGKLESDRYLFFLGASRTFLTLQLSAEARMGRWP